MFLYSFLNGGGLGSSAASLQSKTWQTDSDWSSWSMDKTSLVSSYDSSQADGGVSLSKVGSSYQTAGTAEYRFSPGGTNKWTTASYESDGGGSSNTSSSLWVPLHDTNQVAQFDPITFERIGLYNVGTDPSRTAMGCEENDLWVANRAKGNTDSAKHTISHIYFDADGQSHVKTLNIKWAGNTGNALYEFTTINVQKWGSMCRVFVGAGNIGAFGGSAGRNSYLFTVNGNNFDERTQTEGADISLAQPMVFPMVHGPAAGGTEEFPIWGSAMDGSGKFIYFQATRTQALGVVQVNITGSQPSVYAIQSHDGFPVGGQGQLEADVLFTDAYGLVWASNFDVHDLTYLTIFPDSLGGKSTIPWISEYDLPRDPARAPKKYIWYPDRERIQEGNGIVVIPASKVDPDAYDIFVTTYRDQVGHYEFVWFDRYNDGSLTAPNDNTPTSPQRRVSIDVQSAYSSYLTQNNLTCQAPPTDGAASDAAMYYNENLDFIAIPRGCGAGIVLRASDDYDPTKVEFFEFNPVDDFSSVVSSEGRTDAYNNFIRTDLDNQTGTLNIVYSNKPFSESNPGVSDISKVSSSSDLYIKASFSGDGSLTPTLKSLIINYEGGDGATLVKKETFSDKGFSSKEGTFENAQRVYAKLTINQPSATTGVASVYDEIVNFKVGSIKQEAPLGDGRLVSASPPQDALGAAKLEFKFSSGMKQGDNVIYYSYEASD